MPGQAHPASRGRHGGRPYIGPPGGHGGRPCIGPGGHGGRLNAKNNICKLHESASVVMNRIQLELLTGDQQFNLNCQMSQAAAGNGRTMPKIEKWSYILSVRRSNFGHIYAALYFFKFKWFAGRQGVGQRHALDAQPLAAQRSCRAVN